VPHLLASVALAALPIHYAAASIVTRGADNCGTSVNRTNRAAPDGQWWVDLSLAPLARVPAAQRPEHLQRLRQQQNEASAAIVALGGAVLANVTHVRNAIAVQIPAAQLDAVRNIDGVRSVSAVSQRNRIGHTRCD
jgi:hypothetical protein